MSLTIETSLKPSQFLPKQVECNLCGGKGLRAFDPASGLPLIQCENCLLVSVFRLPNPELIQQIYAETYFKNQQSDDLGYANYMSDEKNIRKTFEKRLRQIETILKPGKVLDVGYAVGFFLSEAKKRGWDAHGVDISRFAIEYAKKNLGVSAEVGTVATVKHEPGTFDLITHWDSIEHVTDPMSSIAHTAKLLKPGGYCVLTTPDISNPPAKIMGKRWIGYKSSQEHLYYFSRKTMALMLEKAGMEVVQTNHVGKYVSLRFFFDRLQSYSKALAFAGSLVEKGLRLSDASVYVNSLDIVSIIARKKP